LILQIPKQNKQTKKQKKKKREREKKKRKRNQCPKIETYSQHKCNKTGQGQK
jgi:hypothetical protein